MTRKLLFRVVFPAGRPARPISEVASRKISRLLGPWLDEALRAGRPLPLPFPAAAGFLATVEEVAGGLLVRLTRPFEDAPRQAPRLATIGVAARADSLESLWRQLMQATGTVGPMPSGAPCCLIVPDNMHAADFPEVQEWLEEFADGVAHAWLERQDNGPTDPSWNAVLRKMQRLAA